MEQFTCDCFPGYLISGVDCVDIDECQMSSPCNENQECFNAVGSFSCRCNDGYRPVDNFGRPSSDGSTDGFQCEDINECDVRLLFFFIILPAKIIATIFKSPLGRWCLSCFIGKL